MAFRDIVGHRSVVQLLERSISRSSLPPSLIFAGPEGVGKRRVAIAAAQALNCPSPIRAAERVDACGVCPTCSRIARGVHPDVSIVEPGENGSIKIEQVRDAIERTIYRPFEAKRRVTIVDDADALGAAGQNALLKILEEPPPSSIFILVTSRQDALLETVRSRCSRVRFAALSPADVAAILQRDHGYSGRDAQAAASAGEGSVGRALQAQAGELADAREAMEGLLLESSGRADARAKVERAKVFLKGSGPVSGEREHLGMQLQAMASVLRDAALLSSGARADLIANADRRTVLERLAKQLDAPRALRSFAAVDRAAAALDRNVSPKVVADWLAIQL